MRAVRCRLSMDNSGAILCQISYLKDMLDQVNEEIEASIQITREIESEIVRCSEVESDLSPRQSELTKMVYVLDFDITGFTAVTGKQKSSCSTSTSFSYIYTLLCFRVQFLPHLHLVDP